MVIIIESKSSSWYPRLALSSAKVKEDQSQISSNDKNLPCYIPKFVQVRGYRNLSSIFETIRSYLYFYEMPCFI